MPISSTIWTKKRARCTVEASFLGRFDVPRAFSSLWRQEQRSRYGQ